MVRIALLAAVLAVMCACSPVCSQAPAATGAAEKLVFTGPQAGTLTTATTTCSIFSSAKQANFVIDGQLGGQRLELGLQVNGYTGPGTYSVGSLLEGAGEVRLQIGSFDADSESGAGQATVNADGKSGSVDANLTGGEHVQGSFACDKVTTG